jgi:hypothetical protein
MALSPEDIAALGSFVTQEVGKGIAAFKAELGSGSTPTVPDVPRDSIVGTPEVPFDAGPEFYVHLADGSVITTHDSQSTHMPNADGTSQQVIGRYQKGV